MAAFALILAGSVLATRPGRCAAGGQPEDRLIPSSRGRGMITTRAGAPG